MSKRSPKVTWMIHVGTKSASVEARTYGAAVHKACKRLRVPKPRPTIGGWEGVGGGVSGSAGVKAKSYRGSFGMRWRDRLRRIFVAEAGRQVSAGHRSTSSPPTAQRGHKSGHTAPATVQI